MGRRKTKWVVNVDSNTNGEEKISFATTKIPLPFSLKKTKKTFFSGGKEAFSLILVGLRVLWIIHYFCTHSIKKFFLPTLGCRVIFQANWNHKIIEISYQKYPEDGT